MTMMVMSSMMKTQTALFQATPKKTIMTMTASFLRSRHVFPAAVAAAAAAAPSIVVVVGGVDGATRRRSNSRSIYSSTANNTNDSKQSSSSSSLFHYNVAITRDIPKSIINQGITKYSKDVEPFNIDLAMKQHEDYVQVLKTLLGPNNVIRLPAIEEYPDCVFVEDTCFIIHNNTNINNNNNDGNGKTIILTNPGHPNRRGEVDTIKDVFVNNNNDLGSNDNDSIIDMRDYNKDNNDADDTTDIANDIDSSSIPYCDGGDVMYTGRHLFVGISERTNYAAIQYLSLLQQQQQKKQNGISNFPANLPIVPVEIPKFNTQALHFKSIVTYINESTVVVPTGQLGDCIIQNMKNSFSKEALQFDYNIIRLPNILACNVVRVNDTILAQDGNCKEDPSSRHILEKEIAKLNTNNNQDSNRGEQLDIIWIDNYELSKVDAALTCCSVLY